MAAVDTTALQLLGKNISFSVLVDDELKEFFPDGISVSGMVEGVLVHLSGNHEILVSDSFYSLDEIQMN